MIGKSNVNINFEKQSFVREISWGRTKISKADIELNPETVESLLSLPELRHARGSVLPSPHP